MSKTELTEFSLYGCKCTENNDKEIVVFVSEFNAEMCIKKRGVLDHSQVKKVGDFGTLVLKYSYAKRLGVV